MKIFKPVWHTPGTYEFCKLAQRGHEIILWESGSRLCKWVPQQRPRPLGVRWTADFNEISSCDVAVMHIGYWTGIQSEFTRIKATPIPRVVQLHSAICREDQRKLVAGEIAIANSPAAKKAWRGADATVVLSSVDLAEWPPAAARPRVLGDHRKLAPAQFERLKRIIGLEAIGRKTWEEYKQNLSDALLFVMLNPADNFPRTRMEAMACGLCVISLASAGEREIYTDGREMILVNSEQQAVRAVRFMLEHRDIARRIGSAARAFILKRQSLNSYLDQVELLLERAIARGRQGA